MIIIDIKCVTYIIITIKIKIKLFTKLTLTFTSYFDFYIGISIVYSTQDLTSVMHLDNICPAFNNICPEFKFNTLYTQ